MLDILYLSDVQGDKPSFSISDRDFKLFESAFCELERKTGVWIDPYGRTRVYPDHQKLLISFLSGRDEDKVVGFVQFLDASIEEDAVLIADGD